MNISIDLYEHDFETGLPGVRTTYWVTAEATLVDMEEDRVYRVLRPCGSTIIFR
jgi:hypothetical protein